MKSHKFTSAFTLIELLVVISIIAILAGIALPVFGQIQVRGAQTKALANAKQVGLACKLFAMDNNGNFPTYKLDVNLRPDTTAGNVADANEAFAQLIPDYVQSEQIFFVQGSAYTKFQPDNKIDNPALQSPVESLKAGENHWAYVLGLTETSNSAFPLLADGFKTATAHDYDKDKTKPGGVWEAKKAIVVRVDGSGEVLKVASTGILKLSPQNGDLFGTAETNWLGATNTVVNPKQ